MKFLIGPMLPTLPATLEDRARLRPIAHHTECWQQMFKEAEQRKIKTPSGEEVDLRVSLRPPDLQQSSLRGLRLIHQRG